MILISREPLGFPPATTTDDDDDNAMVNKKSAGRGLGCLYHDKKEMGWRDRYRECR